MRTGFCGKNRRRQPVGRPRRRWIDGWLVGWLVGWLAGWLVGWLVC
jgi:hypothetical protein